MTAVLIPENSCSPVLLFDMISTQKGFMEKIWANFLLAIFI